MPTSDKMLLRLASIATSLPSSACNRRTNAFGVAWVLLLGLFTLATACSDFKSNNDSGTGGTKPRGGAAGAAATTAQGGTSPADAGGAPTTDVGGASSAAGAAAGGTTTGDGGAAAVTGGSGGCSALTGGSAGQAGSMTLSCTMPPKWLGAVVKPTPIVSVGKTVMTNSTDQTNKGLLVDGKYHVGNGLVFNPTATNSTWASIKLDAAYTKLLLQWQDVGYQDYGPSLYSGTDFKSATSPTGYIIKTSADSTTGDDGTWTTVATVTGNEARGRSHLVPFTGMSWVRFEVTAAPEVMVGGVATMRAVRIDELELHDYSAIGATDFADSYFIMGDSITKMSFDRNRGMSELDELITAQRPTYTPAVVEAGIGGEKLSDALRHLKTEQWLAYSEGLTFVTLAYGTNDSWGGATAAGAGFETTMRSVITALTDAGRVPVLARIPWNTVGTNVAQFNAVIDKLQQEFQLPCGPDLYGLVAAHPEYVGAVGTVQPNCTVKYTGTDGVHPQSVAAKNAIHKAYADALLPLYPAP